jgi:gluconolactonase
MFRTHAMEETEVRRMMNVEIVKVAGNLAFPEGPAYDGKGNIYCSNCNADYITKVTGDGKASVPYRAAREGEPAFTFKKTNGMTFYEDGSLFVCDFGRNVIIRIHPDGRQEIYADNCDGVAFKGPNDLAFDPHGSLYFTDPAGSNRDRRIGALYRVEQDTRRVTKVAGGMGFPNGLAFTHDAKHLYVCESSFNRILRFDVHTDGTLGKAEPFADLAPDGEGAPDGMALDAAGRLWITHYGRHTVLVVDTHGKIAHTIRLPHTKEDGPTNIEFAGKDLKTVYVTDPGDDALWKFPADTPGLALFCAPENEAK